MSWVLFSIVTNPDVEAKLVGELDQQGFLATQSQPQPRMLEYDDIPKLPYLTAVLNESMRLLPVCLLKLLLVLGMGRVFHSVTLHYITLHYLTLHDSGLHDNLH